MNLNLFIVFITGSLIGSFLNVCILRIPAEKSVIFPPSHCPECNNKIAFYDNIPILSWLFLKAECRHCKTKISARYPLVELLTALIFTAIFLKYNINAYSIFLFIFASALIVTSFIDIDHRIIPNLISLPGIIIGFMASGFLGEGFIFSLLGIVLGGGSLYSVAIVYKLISKRDGMGGGDVKLLAMIGAVIGWKGVIFTIFISSLSGTIVGLISMAWQKEDMRLAIPFGPFLAFAALLYLFFGPELISLYLRSLGVEN